MVQVVFPINQSENTIPQSNPSVEKENTLTGESSSIAIHYPQSTIKPGPTIRALKTITVQEDLGNFVTPWFELLIEWPLQCSVISCLITLGDNIKSDEVIIIIRARSVLSKIKFPSRTSSALAFKTTFFIAHYLLLHQIPSFHPPYAQTTTKTDILFDQWQCTVTVFI